MRPGFRAWVVQNEMPTGVIGHGQSRLVEDEFTRVGMANGLHRLHVGADVVALPQLEEVGADGTEILTMRSNSSSPG